MFTFPTCDVEVRRTVDFNALTWPAPGEAGDEGSLGCNRSYMDLRGMPWSEAIAVHREEAELIARVERAADPEQAYEDLEEEIDTVRDGLDLGVASTVYALSAARCIPYSSCNAATFGGSHVERHPLVAFFARASIAKIILACAEGAGSGLINVNNGSLLAYADTLPTLRRFAETLISRRRDFRAVPLPRRRAVPPDDNGQSSLI